MASPGKGPQARALQIAQQQLHAVIDLSPIATWIAENERVVFANRTAASLFGLPSSDSLVGRSVFELLRPGTHAELRRQLALAFAHQGEPGHLQASLVRPDSKIQDVDIVMAALPDHGQTSLQMVVSDVTVRRRELRDLESSRLALRRLSASVLEAREEERRRIARELHDDLGQRLSALKIDIFHWATESGFDAQNKRLVDMLGRFDEVMGSVRRIAADLRPLMLDELGLVDALDALLNDFSVRTGIEVRRHIEELTPAKDDHLSIALYRMVQEALTNVVRHAHATQVEVSIRRLGADMILTVSDNGRGLSHQSSHDGKFGLLGIQEQAEMLGGHSETRQVDGGGFCLRVSLPLTPKAKVPHALWALTSAPTLDRTEPSQPPTEPAR